MADEKLYYTLRYVDKIRLSNLIDNAETLDRDVLYDLDHHYIKDIRYELWCYNGKESVLICEDYFNFHRYDDGDGYEDPVEYLEENERYVAEYVCSLDFLEAYWDKIEDIDDFCEDWDCEDLESLVRGLAYGDVDLNEYYDLLDDSDIFDMFEDSVLEPFFYADSQIVVYARAVKNEVGVFSASYSAQAVENEYWHQRCAVSSLICSASYTLANGDSGTIQGVNAEDFVGVLGKNEALAFADSHQLNVYSTVDGECILSVEKAKYVTCSAKSLYYYEGNDLVCFDGKETTVLAENVYVAECAAWVYADGITLALSDVVDDEGTLRSYKDGEGDWIADDVSYYQRITDKEIIYISDGTLYIYTVGKENVRLADEVTEACGAYYGGILVGYTPAY